MTLPMIANVLTITIVRHGDMLPNTIINCNFAPGNLTGENGFFRVLKTNKKPYEFTRYMSLAVYRVNSRGLRQLHALKTCSNPRYTNSGDSILNWIERPVR